MFWKAGHPQTFNGPWKWNAGGFVVLFFFPVIQITVGLCVYDPEPKILCWKYFSVPRLLVRHCKLGAERGSRIMTEGFWQLFNCAIPPISISSGSLVHHWQCGYVLLSVCPSPSIPPSPSAQPRVYRRPLQPETSVTFDPLWPQNSCLIPISGSLLSLPSTLFYNMEFKLKTLINLRTTSILYLFHLLYSGMTYSVTTAEYCRSSVSSDRILWVYRRFMPL